MENEIENTSIGGAPALVYFEPIDPDIDAAILSLNERLSELEQRFAKLVDAVSKSKKTKGI